MFAERREEVNTSHHSQEPFSTPVYIIHVYTHMARENILNAGHSVVFAGQRDSTQKYGTVVRYAGRLASTDIPRIYSPILFPLCNKKNIHPVQSDYLHKLTVHHMVVSQQCTIGLPIVLYYIVTHNNVYTYLK